MFTVSQSKVGVWRKCRRAYHNKYVERLRRRRIKRPLQFGRIVHTIFEDFANGEEMLDTLNRIKKEEGKKFIEELEEYGDIIDDVRVIITDYFEHWGEDSLKYIRIKGKSAEFTFEYEIAKDIVFQGKIDNLARTPNKLKWLVEHKTGRTIPTEDHRWRSLQSAVYLYVIEKMKIEEVEGTCWDFIRSKAPSTPKILKSGAPSERKCDTLPTKIHEFLEANKLPAAKFQALVDDAEFNRAEYFSRIFTPAKPQLITRLVDDFVETAREMSHLHGSVKAMNITRQCDWCEFEGLCRAELLGQDLEFVKKREYVGREKFEDEEPDFEV